ncbi:hypothetical protein Hanom_Chr10g00916941 [Helianthus anomalus]
MNCGETLENLRWVRWGLGKGVEWIGVLRKREVMAATNGDSVVIRILIPSCRLERGREGDKGGFGGAGSYNHVGRMNLDTLFGFVFCFYFFNR